jgi:hypothetical protein
MDTKTKIQNHPEVISKKREKSSCSFKNKEAGK